MAEHTPQQGTGRGSSSNVDTALLELYRLLAIFLFEQEFR
jgi:hypothetical protein